MIRPPARVEGKFVGTLLGRLGAITWTVSRSPQTEGKDG